MKVVLQPLQKEDAVYYSDFNGHLFNEFGPNVTVKFIFNYGSKNDDQDFEIHLTDEEAQPIIDLIKSKLSEDYKKNVDNSSPLV
jgi:hypothetical protein